MREQLKQDLVTAEGRVSHAYKDSEGYLTIGIGHLIDEQRGGKLPDSIIDALFDYDVDQVEKQLDKTFPWWRSRPDNVQRAMANMVFQMGIAGVSKFARMLSCLQAGDYAGAKREALDSAWAKQTPNRAASVTALFTGG